MSLFAASRLMRTPLAAQRGVFAPLAAPRSPFAPLVAQQRPLSCTAANHALSWAKPAKVVPKTLPQDYQHLQTVRSARPLSPDFLIYQPQLTWLSSLAHRITGAALSTAMYAFATAYVALPLLGYSEVLSSASLLGYVSDVPTWAKLCVKVPLAATFSFHCLNGIRHLSWDSGWFLDLKPAYRAGYTVIAATAVSTVALCML
ncbi:cytochrome b subunit of succinate dehydrogenase, Sdh3p [Malassezia sp. CBS 17886]|nr:cytochrome b subunit of succinate dehydrogenase, Sdh3p [Malassezia sp. CBS 17886]